MVQIGFTYILHMAAITDRRWNAVSIPSIYILCRAHSKIQARWVLTQALCCSGGRRQLNHDRRGDEKCKAFLSLLYAKWESLSTSAPQNNQITLGNPTSTIETSRQHPSASQRSLDLADDGALFPIRTVPQVTEPCVK